MTLIANHCGRDIAHRGFAEATDAITREEWQTLRHAQILLTGGTGFVGKWLLGTLLHANSRMDLGLRICVPSRNPSVFSAAHPQFCPANTVELIAGDIIQMDKILSGRHFTHVIHAATDASAKLNREDPLRMIDTVVGGTRAILRLVAPKPPQRLLFISSGAIYGPQPEDLPGLPEGWRGGPDPLSTGAAYHEAKRLAEQLCAAAARQHGLPHVTIARLFAFVGPHLPLDTHFAVGNFIRDAIAGRPITLTGDGSTVRSYLYASDMAAWILAVMLRGTHLRAYNVGSPQAITTLDLARLIAAQVSPPVPVQLLGSRPPDQPIDRYVPDTNRAITELRISVKTALGDAIRSTLAFHSKA